MARKMKDSGIEWIGEIPEGWEVAKLKNIVSIVRGGSPRPIEAYMSDNDNDVNWIRISDTEKGSKYITHTSRKLIASGISKSRFIKRGSLILTNSMSFGEPYILDIDGCIHDGWVAFSDFKKIDKEFLYYFLTSPLAKIQFEQQVDGGVVKNLNIDKIGDTVILLPSLIDQNKIIAHLDSLTSETNSLLSKTITSIEEYKKLKQAVITQAVTKGVHDERETKGSGVEWIGEIPKEWAVSPMKHFIDILPGYAFSSDDFCIEEGIPLLRGINVGVNEIRWDETVRWNHSISKQLESFFLKENDLVVGLDRPWISDGTRVAFITKKDLPCLLLQRVCRIRTRCNFDIRWIYYWLSGSSFKDSLSTETTGISVPHISTKQIEQFIVAFPNQLEQTQICNYLDAKCAEIDGLIAKKEQLVKELENYKKSLIYEVVTGKREV